MNRETWKHLGANSRDEGNPMPSEGSSWQQKAFREGWIARDKEISEEAYAAPPLNPEAIADAMLAHATPLLAHFPARMPHACIEHVRILNRRALSTQDSTLALRLDRKIDKLYRRWA